jgi:glycosyltransferase involved in cell wall biosynthesis
VRIAQISPLHESVPPKLYGGTERVVHFLTEALIDLGHDVTLFASGDSETRAELVACAPAALRLDETCKDPLAQHVNMFERVFARAGDFDVLHFHTDYLHFALARRQPVAHVTTMHGRMDIPDYVPLFGTFAETPLISISDAQREPLPDANWVGTVYHGLPADLYQPHLGAGKYLAVVGRVSPEKRMDRAVAIARRVGMPLKVAAKIDGKDRDYYESEIKPLFADPLVEFVGEIGEDEKNEFLGNAAAFLFPVDWPEPFGLVMIEAMACGTPVIAFPHGSVPEVIDDGITGFLARDVNSAVKAIDRLPGIDRRQCYETFLKRFSAKRMAEDYSEIYSRIVGEEPESLAFATGASIG